MFKIKKLSTILSILILAMLVFSGCSNNKTSATENDAEEVTQIIRVGTGGTYNPWCFKKDDVLQGFEIDSWNEIGKRLGYEVEFTVSKFSGLVGLLDAGKIDTVAHQMSITNERQEKYNFTEPYAYSKYDFIVKKDSSYKNFEDLKGKKVGAWLGGNGEKTLRELNDKYNLELDMSFYDGTPLEKEVEIGRLDACWQGAIKSQTTIVQGDLDVKLLGINVEIGSEINAYPFAKTEDGAKLSNDVSKIINEMHEDGTFAKLSEKWFNLDTTKK